MDPANWTTEAAAQPLVALALVLARVGGLVLTAPIFGGRNVPFRVRCCIALTLAVVICPIQSGASIGHLSPIELLLAMAGEAIVGVALGIGLVLLLAGMQIAGQIICQMSGMSLADVLNPGSDEEAPLFSSLLYLFALAVFLTIGGERLLMGALLDTFVTIPLGTASFESRLSETLTALVDQSMSLGVRAAAPAATALLLATLVLGLISRTLPQFNVLAMGFGINALVTFVTVALSLGAIAWGFQEQVRPFLQQVLSGLSP